MISKLDTQTLESIHRLNTRSEDWQKILASIKADRDMLTTKLISCDNEHDSCIYQGMLRWINKFLSNTDSASETLHKRKESK